MEKSKGDVTRDVSQRRFLARHFNFDMEFVLAYLFVFQVTTVQLNNNTDRNWGATALRQDFPNGTLLRTFEQQQDKGTCGASVNLTNCTFCRIYKLTARETKLWSFLVWIFVTNA